MPAIAGNERFIATSDQTRYCVRPTRPIPMIFPSISSVGRTDAITSSTMRFVFSSMTPRRFWKPYMKNVMYMIARKTIAAMMPPPFSSVAPLVDTLRVFRSTRFSSSLPREAGSPCARIFSRSSTALIARSI